MIAMRRMALTIILGTCSISGVAMAQPKSDTSAEAIFEEGLAKFDKGDFAAACPLLARAVELSSTEALGGLLTLAECYEKIDRPASAWGLYRKVAARAAASNQADRAELARKSVARLEPFVPKVAFRAPDPVPPGLRVKFGGETIPADVWTVPLPIDPGEATFVFEADGRAPKTSSVTIPKGSSTTEVSPPSLDLVGPSADTGDPTLSPLLTPKAPDEGGSALEGLGIAGIVIGAVGVGGLFASLGVALDAKSKWDEAVTNECDGDPTRCTSLTGIDDARGQGDAASAVFGISLGLAAVGAGLLIVDLATGKSDASARTTLPFAIGVTPVARAGDAGAVTQVRFAW